MKKTYIITALIISAAMLTACDDKSDSLSDYTSDVSGSSAQGAQTEELSAPDKDDGSDSGDARYDTAETDHYGISATGLDGAEISEEELTNIYVEGSDGEYDPVYALGEGFTYLAEPAGICLNSRDNSDIFNEEELTFEGVPLNAPAIYKRYNIGDTICGLTLTDASTNFYCGRVDSTWAELEGSVTMTGYVTIAPEDEYGIDEGDIFFVPCPDNDLIPVINFRYEEADPVNPLYVAMSEGFARVNEYSGSITLGNIHRTDLNLSGVPADYSFSAKATVTVDKVNMSCSGFSCYTVCNMTDFELL